jgi:hypothetical protein
LVVDEKWRIGEAMVLDDNISNYYAQGSQFECQYCEEVLKNGEEGYDTAQTSGKPRVIDDGADFTI